MNFNYHSKPFIKYPLKNLDISKYMRYEENLNYNLFAVIHH